MGWFDHTKELEALESTADRRRVVAEARRRLDRALWLRRLWLSIVFSGVLTGLIAVVTDLLLAPWLSAAGIPRPVMPGVAGGIAGSTSVLFLNWLYRRRYRRELRLCLRECGIPMCLHCGYDLRGQTEPRCPECGREFDADLLESSTRRSADVERPGETTESSREDFGT